MTEYIMNRESLRKHCESNCERFKNIPTSGTYSEHKFILDLLNQTEWIPVSERLPEFEQNVLAWVENKDPEKRFNKPGIYIATLRNRVPEHDLEGKRNFWGIPGYDSEWSVLAWSYFSEPDVKAWMPLPTPYEEGEEE